MVWTFTSFQISAQESRHVSKELEIGRIRMSGALSVFVGSKVGN